MHGYIRRVDCMAMSEQRTTWLWHNKELHGYGTTGNCMGLVEHKTNCMAMAEQRTAWLYGRTKNCMVMVEQRTNCIVMTEQRTAWL